MKKSPLLIALLGFSLTANALAAECNLYHPADFLSSLTAIQDLKLPIATLAASPALFFPDDNDTVDKCSSSVVSDNGTMLTAGHCVSHCFQQQDFTRDISLVEGHPAFRIYNLEKMATAPVTCTAYLNGTLTAFRVVAAKYCEVLKQKKEFSDEGILKTCEAQPDYAILQPVSPVAPMPCLKVNPSPDFLGRPVAVIGFPTDTHRAKALPTAKDSDGVHQFISLGTAIHSSECTIPEPKTFGYFGGSETISLDGFEKMKPEYLQTDADMAPGNSGGPVIDRVTGRVLALSSDVVANHDWDKVECRGGNFATSIAQVQKELLAKNPLLPQLVFSCNRMAAIPDSSL